MSAPGPSSALQPSPPSAPEARWSPNQEAARRRIATAAARLVAREGLEACTIRGVADEAELKKSTVHYYVDDANELVDMAVLSLMSALADDIRPQIEAAPDGPAALATAVRLFTGQGSTSIHIADPTVWLSYTTHAWRHGAQAQLLRCLDVIRGLFDDALLRCGVADPWRARAIHHYLLGMVQRATVTRPPVAEVAAAVSALAGVDMAPELVGNVHPERREGHLP